jgi:hypothetical protein
MGEYRAKKEVITGARKLFISQFSAVFRPKSKTESLLSAQKWDIGGQSMEFFLFNKRTILFLKQLRTYLSQKRDPTLIPNLIRLLVETRSSFVQFSRKTSACANRGPFLPKNKIFRRQTAPALLVTQQRRLPLSQSHAYAEFLQEIVTPSSHKPPEQQEES